MTVILAMHWLG